jgi:hypothetical protein
VQRFFRLAEDFLLPVLAYCAIIPWMIPVLPGQLFESLGAATSTEPSDSNGTIWFWWWLHYASTHGLDLLNPEVVCAPGGQGLGGNFPNRMDAWLAWPFFALFTLPAAYNLTILFFVVLDSYLGYLFVRRLCNLKIVSWVAGFFFGFNAYTFAEYRGGRPVTGLVACLPLFGMLFLEALERAPARNVPWWLWAGLAGAAGAFAVQSYLPFAIFLLIWGLAAGLCRLVVPAQGVPRWRVLVVGGIIVFSGVVLSLPYLHEVTVVRGVNPAGGQVLSSQPAAIYELRLYSELWTSLKQGQQGPRPAVRANWFFSVQSQSQPYFYLWKRYTGEASQRLYFPARILLILAVLALFGRYRGLCWLGASVLVWSITIGPFAATSVEASTLRWVMWEGQRVATPLAWILSAVPSMEVFLRPYRAFPLFLLCIVSAGAIGSGSLASSPLWKKIPHFPEWGARALLGLFWLGLGLFVRSLLLSGNWLVLPVNPWKPDPFMVELAENPEKLVIAELPAGIGHGASLLQVYHQKYRSEGHHDELFRVAKGMEPPRMCYNTAFSKALWYVGQDSSTAEQAVEQGFSKVALEEVVAQGFRYIVVYTKAYRELKKVGAPVSYDRSIARLKTHFGEPSYQSETLIVFKLTPAFRE